MALAVIGVVTSVVGAYYYFEIVKIMYFDEARPAFDSEARRCERRRSVCTIFVAASVDPAALFNAAAAAARSLF